jgi:hypothetical protein
MLLVPRADRLHRGRRVEPLFIWGALVAKADALTGGFRPGNDVSISLPAERDAVSGAGAPGSPRTGSSDPHRAGSGTPSGAETLDLLIRGNFVEIEMFGNYSVRRKREERF